MKKTFILLFSLGTITTVFAQASHTDRKMNDVKDVKIARSEDKNDRFDDKDLSTADKRNRDLQIKRINNEYDKKIQAVRKDRHLRSEEKSKKIRLLEREREEKIREVNRNFSRRSVSYDNRYEKNRNK